MCGIAGFVTVQPSDSPSIIERMTDTIRHRGPDDSGYYSDAWASLGFRRLAIIDVAGGHQPMPNEDGSQVHHLQRRNFQSRRPAPSPGAGGPPLHQPLRHRNHPPRLRRIRPRTASLKLRGMFAFAIWDKHARKLFCARDRLGKKPFYYFWDGRTFVFASEIKALLQHPADLPAVRRIPAARIPRLRLRQRRAHAVPRHPQADARPSPHARPLARSSRSPRIQRYWDIPEPAPRIAQRRRVDCRMPRAPRRDRLHAPDERRAARHVPLRRRRFQRHRRPHEAQLRRAREDLRGRLPRGANSANSPTPARSPQAIGTEHHEVVVGMDDFFNALPRLIWHEDEPIAWPSSVSLYFVSQLAARAGQGGADRRRQRRNVRRLRPLPLLRHESALAAAPTACCPARCARAIRSQRRHHASAERRAAPQTAAHLPRPRRGLSNRSTSTISTAAFPAAEQHALFRNLSSRVALRRLSAAIGTPGPTSADLDRMLYADQKTYLVELLMKQDQMSMAGSHRKPRAVPRSRIRRVLHPRPRPHETAQRRGQVHRQESHRRPAPARHHLPQENGLPHAPAPVAPRSPRRRPLRHHARPRWTARLLHRSCGSSKISSTCKCPDAKTPRTASGGC